MFYFKEFGIHFLIDEDIEAFHGIEWHSQIPADMRGILGMWEKNGRPQTHLEISSQNGSV